jgi:malate dehydrogenase (oxaloacetate-decarboxylating)
MTIQEQALQLHEELQGKLEVVGKCKVENAMDLALAYTPGVAEPCKKIHANKEDVYKYTMKGRTVAVVTDGTAVLGLGDIGPEAALPVMEGKALLFKAFANVDAIPICLDTKDPDKIVEIVKAIAPGFGGINLEDIAAPRCFEIEERLKKELDIPVFHDDQHGTAIVVLAGIINALKLVNKAKEEVQVVVNGAGAAGTAITKLLLSYGFANILMVDRMGILYRGAAWMNWSQQEMAEETNLENMQGDLATALKNSDIFIGVSAPNIVSKDMIASMNQEAIVFAMANPVPEIMPELAIEAGARVVGTGRSDFPNQVNNVLAFPGIFKGVLQARARQITQEMKLAAAEAIASMIPDQELSEVNILPKAFDKGVADQVAEAVIRAAKG